MIYLQITLNVSYHKRKDALANYLLYRNTILHTVNGVKSIDLLMRDDDFQILHTFNFKENVTAYLESAFYIKDVVGTMKPLLDSAPYVRIYQAVDLTKYRNCY